MSGVLRLSNNVTGRSTIIASASNDQTFTLPATGGTLLAGGSSLEVIFPSGTEALPGLHVESDVNTGLYSPTANTLGISTDGTEAMRIDSAGNVGIGTSSPNLASGGGLSLYNASNARLKFANSNTGTATGDGTQIYALGLNFHIENKEAGYIATYTSGLERLRIDSSGNVGIGTTSPQDALHIAVPSAVLRLEDTDTNHISTIQSTAAALVLSADATDSVASTYLGLSVDGSERLRIDSSGNVGIGTTSPQGNLQISESSTGATIRLTRPGSADYELYTSSDTFILTDKRQSTERMRIDNAGRVGIGTSSPTTQLHVNNSSGTATIRVSSQANSEGVTLSARSDGNGSQLVARGTSSNLRFYTQNSSDNLFERMRLDSTGSLLVGTTSSAWPYRIVAQGGIGFTAGSLAIARAQAGSTVASGGDIGYLTFGGNDYTAFAQISAWADGATGSGDYPGRLVFSTTANGASSSTERMRIAQNGHVRCVGFYSVTTASGANMHVESDGDVKRSTSSKKYKTAIEDIENTYSDALLDCRPVWYRSTCTGDNPEHGFWGFIAEEVAKIDPRLVFWKTKEVTYDEKGSAVSTPCDPEPEGVVYDRFVPHLLNLIKRQQAAIETLEQRLSDAGIA